MAMFLFRNLNNDLNTVRPSQLLDQHFGLGLTPEELLNSLVHPHGSNGNMLRSPGYFRPWKLTRNDNGSTVKFNKDAFQVNLDVQQFLPEEINVKSSGNSIIVEAKHDEREDEHGFISRSFIRKYILPEGHDINGVVSTLSSDGILTITAPKIAEPKSVERIIPITQTGPHKKLQQDEKTPEENQE